MPQSSAILTSQAAGYLPFAQGIPHERPNPLQGMPLVGHGGMGGMAGMALAPQIHRAFGQVGMVPMGVGHDQNVFDLLMRQRFSQAQMQAMQLAAEVDRDAFFRTFRGMAALTGTPFGSEQRRAANALTSAAVMSAPVMATMMPEFMDQMGGFRGSAAVMASRMMDAGRYRLDPVTGRMGMTAESVGHITRQIYQDFYNDRNLGQNMGLTAGQYGSLFTELQRRGAVGGFGSAGVGGVSNPTDIRAHVIRAVEDLLQSGDRGFRQRATQQGIDLSRGAFGLSAQDLDKLQLDSGVSDRLRSFDAERIKRSLKSYTSAVAAMRDIFGDMGRPNAPMQELIAGLEAMTLGSTSQIDPGRLGMLVRQTHNLSRQTGVSLDNALLLQQHAATRAQQMGLEPIFGVQATQGALAYGGAYRAMGMGAGHSWGMMNADQVTQLDTNLRVQAASSNMANRMAVALRLSETGGGFDADTDAGRYVAAVRAGLNQFRDGQGRLRSVNLSNQEFTSMLSGATRNGRSAGISEGDVQSLLGQTQTNREYVQRFGLADITRRAQGTDELHPFITHRMQETLFTRFRDNLTRVGVDGPEAERQARRAAEAVSQQVTQGMFRMDPQQFRDTQSRNRAISDLIQHELHRTNNSGVLRGLDYHQQTSFLQQTADQFTGHANRAIQGSMYRAFGNLQNVFNLTNQNVLNEADRQQMQARFTSEMQEAMAPLGRGTILSRAVDALQGVRPDDPLGFQRVVAQALGGVRHDDINRALMPAFRRVMEQRQAVQELQERIVAAHDPDERADLMQQLTVRHRELTAQAQELAQLGEQHGMFSVDSVTHEDLARAGRTTRTLMTAQNDLVGLRGNFGHEVSQAQIRDVRRGPGRSREDVMRELGLQGPYDRLTPAQQVQVDQLRGGRQGTQASATEAAAVILARRATDVDAIGRYVTAEHQLNQAQTELGQLREVPEAQRGDEQRRRITELEARVTQLTTQRDEARTGMTDEQKRTLEGTMTQIRQDHARRQRDAVAHLPEAQRPPIREMNEGQARMLALQFLRNNMSNIPDSLLQEQMRGLDIRSDEEARALLRTQRRLTPVRATPEEIDRILTEHRGTMTREEATELANARLRARRLGVDRPEIEGIQDELNWEDVNREIAGQAGMADLARRHREWAEAEDWTRTGRAPDRKTWRDSRGQQYTDEEFERYQRLANPIRRRLRNPQNEVEAIGEAFSRRAFARSDVTEEDRAEFRRRPGYTAPTDDQVRRFRETEGLGADVNADEVRRMMLDRAILGRRQQEHRDRFNSFWNSDEGAAFREATDLASQDVENLSVRLIQTPQMVQRLGTRAVEMHEQLRVGQQRLRELALYHTSGDMARLMAGDFNIDQTTVQGQVVAARVRGEISRIQREQRSIIGELEEQEGLPGRRFQLGDEGDARRRVLDREVAAGRMTRQQADALMNSAVSPQTRRAIAARARELGSEENARRILGIDPSAQNLTELQQAMIAGVRWGAGNEAEVIGVFGRERWDRLSATQQQETMARLRQGTGGNRQQALQILGLTEDQVRNDTSGEAERRVAAVMVGLQTDAHARQLAGIRLDADLSQLPAAQRQAALDQVQAMRLGIASHDWARSRMGLPADQMTPALREQVERERELMGNELEARRLLGVGPGLLQGLGDEDRSRVRRLAGGGLTRDQAMEALGFRGGNVTQLSRTLQARVQAVANGSNITLQRAVELLGVGHLRPNQLTDQHRANLRRIMQGAMSEQEARTLLGDRAQGEQGAARVQELVRGRGMTRAEAMQILGFAGRYEDLSPQQRQLVDRVATGATMTAQEAVSALGLSGRTYDQLSDEEKRQVDQAVAGLPQGEAGLSQAAAMLGLGGRRVLTDEDRRRMDLVRQGGMNAVQAMELLGLGGRTYDSLSVGDQNRVQAAMRGLGSEEHAAITLGLGAHYQNTRTLRAAIDGTGDTEAGRQAARRAAGITDEEWRLFQQNPNTLSADKRRRYDIIRQGVGSEAYARTMLGIAPAAQLQGNQAQQLALLRQGSGGNEQQARQRLHQLGIITRADADLSDARGQSLLMAAMHGTGSLTFARAALGMGDAPVLSQQQQQQVQQQQQRLTTDAAAMSLLTGQADSLRRNFLTDEQRRELEGITQSIGLARRVTPQQEQQIRDLQQTEQTMQQMATRQGVSLARMQEAAGRGFAVGTGPTAITVDQAAQNPRQTALAQVTQARQQREQATARLREIQQRLQEPGLTDEIRRQLLQERDQLVGRIGTLQQQEQAAHQSLRPHAQRMGVTTTELLAGHRSQRILTQLSTPERERLDTATQQYQQATHRAAAARGQIARIQQQLQALGTDTTDENRNNRRQSLQAALQQAQGNLADAVLGQQQAMGIVGQDAERRGVSVQEYLTQGMGRVTGGPGGTTEQFRQLQQRRDQQRTAVGNIATALGTTIENLFGVTGITDRLQRLQQQVFGQENQNPQQTVRGLLQEYGFRQSGDESPLGQDAQRLAQLMEGTQGRSMGRRMLETARTLRQRAEMRSGGPRGLAGVDEMARRYFEALNTTDAGRREEAMRSLQQDYGFDMSHGRLTGQGNAQWQAFEQAMQFQQQTGLLRLGRERSGLRTQNSESNLAALFNQALQGGQMQHREPPAVHGTDGQQPGRMELHGTVTLRGDQLDMAGAWGGGRGMTPPGGT